MHIALVRTEFIARRGGAERYAVNLARRWTARGHRVSVVCHKVDVDDARGVEVVRVSRPKVLGPFKHGWFATRAGKAAAALGADRVLCLARAWPGDVLRLGDGLHWALMRERYTGAALKLARLNPRHRQLLKLEADLFKPGRFGAYVANSELVRDMVVEHYGVSAHAVTVIPNGVDFDRFNLDVRARREEVRQMLKASPGAEIILFAGMDLRRKGLDAVTRGFIALAAERPAAMLVCAGKGDTDAARQALRAAGLEGRCRFLPPSDDMAGLYACADVFVLPTQHDPSANAVTEALACGVPVITSAENGARQHLVAGVNGFVMTSRKDAGEFAELASALLASPRDPREVQKASGLISLDENAERLLDVLVRARQEVGA